MILMNDFKAEPTELRSAMLESVSRVINSGWFVLGKEVEEFEKIWADSCNSAYALGVANGLDAIEIALRTLDISEGDEVITTPMTAFATVLAIIRAGAIPVLADIDSNTGLLSIDSVKRCVTKKTKAIVLVHLYGQIRDMYNWQLLCEDLHVELIEDCAQAHLASSDGIFAGTFGKFGAFSFYPTKNLGAVGDAGALITSDSKLFEKASYLRNYGQTKRYHHPFIGLNSRLDEIQAAMLIERLKWLPQFTKRRQEIASIYYKYINHPNITLLSRPESENSHVYHLFVVLCDRRDQLQEYLLNEGIQTHIHYPIPIHFQEPCFEIKRDVAGLTKSELHASRCLSLPCHPQMTDEDVYRVIESINLFGIV